MPRPLIFSGLSGLLLALSFPPFNFSILAFIAFVPLLYNIDQDTQPVWVRGAIAGFISNVIIYSWIWKTLLTAELGWVVTLFSWVGLALILSVYFIAFIFIYKKIGPHWSRPWLAGITWVCLEHIRTIVLTGFPWALLSHTQTYQIGLIQIASITGAPAISYLIISTNGVISDLTHKRVFKQNLIFITLVFLGFFIFGKVQLKNQNNNHTTIKFSLLQGNINQYQKWSAEYVQLIKNTYASLSDEAVKSNPDIIIWPESALPGWYPNEKNTVAWVHRVVQKSRKPHLFGTVARINGKDFNSAYFIDPKSLESQRYDKNKLVPFGEYLPFGDFLKKHIPYLGRLGIFDPGHGLNLIQWNNFQFAVNICYEAMFPNLIRHSVKNGADLIINMTNDGWFLDTAAPEQHYVTNIFRAIENRRPVVRVANTGISAIIDPTGREVVRSELLRKKVLNTAVSVNANAPLSFYSQWGNWFTLFSWIILVGWSLIGILRNYESRTVGRNK